MHEKSGVWKLSIGVLISSSLSLFRALNKKVTTISLYLVSPSPWGLLMALRQIQSLLAFPALGTGFSVRPVGTEIGQ